MNLSPRQLDCLRLAADGHTYAEIGQQLNISRGTVRDHLGQAIEKLKARNTIQAVAIAYRSGLLDEHSPEVDCGRDRFRIYALPFAHRGAEALGITHDECPTRWHAEVDDFSALAELVQRADEHTEVCR